MATNSNGLRGALLATTALVAGVGGAGRMASIAFAQNILRAMASSHPARRRSGRSAAR